MNNKSIGFIGGGRITGIFLKAFANQNVEFDKIIVYDPNHENLMKLKGSYPQIVTDSNTLDDAAKCDTVFIAVHPPVVIETLTKIIPFITDSTMIVSLAPKITIDKIKAALNGFQNIARVNPSAGGVINQGINPVAFHEGVSKNQQEDLLKVLGILGKTPIVNETKIEGYAVISAMGPTYFWFQLQKLEELALKFGMDRDEAKDVISEMLKGTINTLFNSGIPYEEVMDLVPAKPISEYEDLIKSVYNEKLNGIYEKIRP